MYIVRRPPKWKEREIRSQKATIPSLASVINVACILAVSTCSQSK